MKHVLIIGRPGIGKTTLIRRLTQTLRRFPIDGFLTEESREDTQRVGFWLSALDGRQVLLAHRQLASPVHVGPYKVNLAVLEQVAVPVIHRAMQQTTILFLDELGKMELSSPVFERAVQEAFDRGPSIVATAGVGHVPFVDALKRRKDVELIPLSASNRAAVEEELAARLTALCAEDDEIRAIQRHADLICGMIVSGEASPIDIEIQQAKLREMIARLLPEKDALYHLIYETRFRRLWQQFRHH
ncbi:MAG: hypothetical protein HY737_06315 [Candidatus Omnitrophica bacterium]|nr:hypothetical protein [Candidatus Omnitrophota bacterium]